MKNLLIVFAKYPTPGVVKTRLARDIGHREAARIYRQLVRFTLDKFTPLSDRFHCQIAIAPAEKIPTFQKEFPGANGYFAQWKSGDLGERLHNAIAYGLQMGYEKIAVIGTDSPHMPVQFVDRAFEWLADCEVVLGPAEDGGYYLIAVQADLPFLFQNVLWGSRQVLAQTKSILSANGLTFELLPELYDVDYLDDLLRLQADAPEILAPLGTLKPVKKLC